MMAVGLVIFVENLPCKKRIWYYSPGDLGPIGFSYCRMSDQTPVKSMQLAIILLPDACTKVL